MFYLCGLIKKSNILIGLVYKTKGMIFGLVYCSILYFGLLYRTITVDKWTCIVVHKSHWQTFFYLCHPGTISYMCKEPFRIRKKITKNIPRILYMQKTPSDAFFQLNGQFHV